MKDTSSANTISTTAHRGPHAIFYGALGAALIGWVSLSSAPVNAQEAVRVFTPAEIINWEPHSFSGETSYELVTIDGRQAVHAVCENGTASGLFLQDDVDLNETPVVEWEWRVDSTFSGINERVRAGDDYPARIYAVDERSFRIWATRALNYVWASEEPAGADWPNAYQSRAHMIAMQSGTENAGEWITERRNLQEDFKTFHDRELDSINAFAIMTDCDDVNERAEAWYGDIRLLAE